MFWGRRFPFGPGGPFWCCCARAFRKRHVSPTSEGSSTGRKMILRKLWREFFSDPSQWWDHRSEKVNRRYRDFKHKKTQDALWLKDNSNPPWVEAELAAMAPGILQSNSFAWNVKLQRYVKGGHYKKTIEVFQEMQQGGLNADEFTFVPLLGACAGLQSLEEGKRIHMLITQTGHESEPYVANCLVHMYAKCGSIEDAHRVFNKMPVRDVVAWSAMIIGYVNCGESQKALQLFCQMQLDGVEPNPITFVGVLRACTSAAALEEGRCLHEQIIRRGHDYDDVILSNSLVNMYVKCGSTEDARIVFNKMLKRNVVSWSSMIQGYAKCGEGQKALELFWQMFEEGLELDPVVLVAALNACASTAALQEGRRVHEQIAGRGYDSNDFVGSSLINMYVKCGSIEDALRVFNRMCVPDMVTWTSMLAGYAKHGYVTEALEHFERMCQEGVEVNEVTFISLLSACSHGGLMDEALHYVESMSQVHNISPTIEHYACVIDLFSRAGRLHEAEDLVRCLALEQKASVWMSLLSACRVHGNVEIGERGAEQVLKLEPENAAGCRLLANIYAAGKRELT